MWGRTNKHNACAYGDGAAGTEIDLSACTAAPSGLPSALTSAKAVNITANNPEDALATRRVYDELQVVFDVVRAAGACTMDVRPWFYLPEFKRDATGAVGAWKPGRLLEAIPRDADTTAEAGTIYRVPVPGGATHLYMQRAAVSATPDSSEAAVYGAEEVE